MLIFTALPAKEFVCLTSCYIDSHTSAGRGGHCVPLHSFLGHTSVHWTEVMILMSRLEVEVTWEAALLNREVSVPPAGLCRDVFKGV